MAAAGASWKETLSLLLHDSGGTGLSGHYTDRVFGRRKYVSWRVNNLWAISTFNPVGWLSSNCVCACVRACVRACARACVRVCVCVCEFLCTALA